MPLPLIKDATLIVSKSTNTSGGVDYVLTNSNLHGSPTKLGDVFNYLPSGVIDKTETGIGGTSLELDADRDSIVVEPFVITAYNKSKNLSISNRFEVHFYGKDPDKFRQKAGGKISTSIFTTNADLALVAYIEKVKANGKPIKIACVTDQLSSLKNALDVHQNGLFGNLFLVLDEIDCLQEHSRFRGVMDECLTIYKLHPKDHRVLISATIKEFHDPVLKQEPVSVIKYFNPIQPILELVNCNRPAEETYAIIKSINKKAPQQKIVIALNNIQDCFKLANKLKHDGMPQADIKILCSRSSSSKVADYFDILNNKGQLPGKINFITSALFNGVDINESYHCIIVSDGMSDVLRLSPSVILQVAGRCRKKLFSNKLVVRIRQRNNYKIYTLQELETQAKEMVKLQALLQNVKKSNSANIKCLADEIDELIQDGTSNYFSLVYRDEEGKTHPSYLKIDSRIDQQETYNIYKDYKTFLAELNKRFKTVVSPPLTNNAAPVLIKTKPAIEGIQIIDQLKALPLGTNYTAILQTTIIENAPLKKLFEIYNYASKLPNTDFNKLEILLRDIVVRTDYANRLTLLLVSLDFMVNVSGKGKVWKQIEKHFPINRIDSRDNMEKDCMFIAETLSEFKKPPTGQKKFFDAVILKPKIILEALILTTSDRTNKARSLTVVGYTKYNIFK